MLTTLDMWFIIILVIMETANVVLHGVGIYLLVCIGRRNKKSIQNLIILNISVSECLINFLGVIQHVLTLLAKHNIQVQFSRELGQYLTIFIYAGLSLTFYMEMFYIAIDRLLNVLFTLRYRVYCTKKKAEILMTATWFFSMLIGISAMLAYYFVGFSYLPLYYQFVYPTLDFIYIIVAIVTYIYIFKQIAASEEFRRNANRSITSKCTIALRKSKFLVPVMIISTFLMFMVLPDLIILFVGLSPDMVLTEDLKSACSISYAISNICDACIYIFMKKTVRDLFIKKFKILFRIKDETDEEVERQQIVQSTSL